MKYEEYEIPEDVLVKHKQMVKKELRFKELLSREEFTTAYQQFSKMDKISMEQYMEKVREHCTDGTLVLNVLIDECNSILTGCGIPKISDNDKELFKLNNSFFNYHKDLTFLIISDMMTSRMGLLLEIKNKVHLRADDELQYSKDETLSPLLRADIQRIKLDRRAIEMAMNFLKREYPKSDYWWQQAQSNNLYLEDLFQSVGGYDMNLIYQQYCSIMEAISDYISIEVKTIQEVYHSIKSMSAGEMPVYRNDIGLWVVICSFEGLL